MRELGCDPETTRGWFAPLQATPFVRIEVAAEHAAQWAEILCVPLRRCYITDAALETRAQATGRSKTEVLAAKLPDPGATMAGDFGEVIAYLYHAGTQHPALTFGPKKWRLKQDRTKPAPHSDVVLFVLPVWPQVTQEDTLICSEVKTKSTQGSSVPVVEALAGSVKDRTSRLAKTLAWLKDRALGQELGAVDLPMIERFLHATDHPQATKRFFAVAVVCSSLLINELQHVPSPLGEESALVVISVPDLHGVYNDVFRAIHASVDVATSTPQPSGDAS